MYQGLGVKQFSDCLTGVSGGRVGAVEHRIMGLRPTNNRQQSGKLFGNYLNLVQIKIIGRQATEQSSKIKTCVLRISKYIFMDLPFFSHPTQQTRV